MEKKPSSKKRKASYYNSQIPTPNEKDDSSYNSESKKKKHKTFSSKIPLFPSFLYKALDKCRRQNLDRWRGLTNAEKEMVSDELTGNQRQERCLY